MSNVSLANDHRPGLASCILIDALAAAGAASLISPLIAIIDRSVVERTAHGTPLRQSWRNSATTLLRQPRSLFSRPFAIMHGLYFSTYMTANTCDTLHAGNGASPTLNATVKFAAVSAVNMACGICKDTRFAAMFGRATAKAGAVSARRAVPWPTLALFFVRDTVTIFASFNLPPMLAPRVPDAVAASSAQAKRNVAQMACPAAVQLVSTPLHLAGLDLYNRPAARLADRARLVCGLWGGACAARVARIVPAFGVGGVVNQSLREKLMSVMAK